MIQYELLIIVSGWVIIKVIEWAASNKRSVLTEQEAYILKRLHETHEEDREAQKEIIFALRDVAVTQLEIAHAIKNVIVMLQK